jgi:sec-independent protein translocase protein TatB
VFGLSFGELCVLVIVAIVVIGPKDMPRVLRKAGQLAGKLRRMATDVRAQSGIDEVLRAEGLNQDIAEIRRLAQGEFMDPIARPYDAASRAHDAEVVVVREREYPREGADSYDATPDTAILYAKSPSPSSLARDPLYVKGDESAVLEPPPPPQAKPELPGELPDHAAPPAETA